MPTSDYVDVAYAKAITAGTTADQAARAKYRQVASACDVTVGPSGDSPRDFFWQHVKQALVRRLQEKEADTADTALKARIRPKIEQLAEYMGAEIEVVRAGEFERVTGPVIILRRAP